MTGGLVLLEGAVSQPLRSFLFEKINIAKSFAQELATRSESIAIIRAVTGLGKRSDAHKVAPFR
jgi:predicted signal transduction protein with EAL and GGDEF domain